ncbi:MAG: FAD-dependent oxidoreductase [Candidatus Thorarchaeota archaeon]|nr:FAD-dependent oxidoreductase [Candidatus Thorarchaeota archaeon]
MTLRHEVVIVGAGLAGLRTAIELAENCDTAVLSKVHPLRSHSVAAQGGVNAALSESDSWQDHAFDTVKGSDYLADQDVVEILAKLAPMAVIENERWGTAFSRTEDGRIAQRPFGGAMYPRTCYAADRTGHNLLHTTFEQALRLGVKFYNEWFATSIVRGPDRVRGLTALNIATGEVHGISAKAVVIATGGFGRIYGNSTNALINTGDGCALALRAGVGLKDMEFVQFHPTTLFGSNILITEGARGEGGLLFNRDGERFMSRYAPEKMELAPRDIVARAIRREIDEGRGFEGGYVHLDLRHLGRDRILERLPGIREICMEFAGVDPIEEPIPVVPGQHYSMGGIDCNKNGETSLPGLYAVGEAACMSLHGANRLGGNSLVETLVFGRVVGKAVLDYIKRTGDPADQDMEEEAFRVRHELQAMLMSGTDYLPAAIREELNRTMDTNVGVFRSRESLEKALTRVRDLRQQFKKIDLGRSDKRYNYAMVRALELQNMLDLAEPIIMGALAREESRGAHWRVDYPRRDDSRFLKHTVVTLARDGLKLHYADVHLGMFEVKERTY